MSVNVCLSHKMKTKNKNKSENLIFEGKFGQCKVDFIRNWRIIAVFALILTFYALRILMDITAEPSIQTITPLAGGTGGRYSNDEENLTLRKNNDFKTILLWNTLFNDETFGLRQDSVQSTPFKNEIFWCSDQLLMKILSFHWSWRSWDALSWVESALSLMTGFTVQLQLWVALGGFI